MADLEGEEQVMGMFTCPMRIETMDGRRSLDLEATVDTGAAYTTVPGRLLRELGVEPGGRRSFVLADGRRIEGAYGRAWVSINGETEVTIVVFGADDGPVLLGAYTLEGLSLAVDPVQQRLVPTAMIL
ncbi:MAG: hypothetical protein OXG66_01125 [Acidimicrobiaceae bacterium]|nr:hypothetical protein [Acidimicrobiaceae bacterium]